jgi:hypothetical protein
VRRRRAPQPVVVPGGTSCAISALMQNGIIDTQVQRCFSDTGQKRLAEKRGSTTAVPPAHSVASTE